MDNTAIDHRCKWCKATMSKDRTDKVFCDRNCKAKHQASERKKERGFIKQEPEIKKGRKGKHRPKQTTPPDQKN